jgi:hypothetical protein
MLGSGQTILMKLNDGDIFSLNKMLRYVQMLFAPYRDAVKVSTSA